ncbi:MAG: amino acid ABC transporter substrate-binding protein [Candidatus Rokubacteria bacterium]|nr:amino acid ABC transporter substrate-binding protein [Candidatus Rokubacteria bacterium]
MRTRRLVAPALLLALSLVLLAGSVQNAASQAKAPDAILVGATIAATGPMSAEVGPFKKMMENWAEMVNAKGGIMVKEYGRKLPVKFIIYDDTSKPPDSARLYEKLVTEDKVHVLLGPYSSPITAQASTVGEKHQIPFIALEANASPIFRRGFKWLVGVIDDGPKWSYHYFDMLKAEGKAKSIAFVIEDTPHPKEVGSGSIPKAKEIGLKVVVEEYFPVATQDFTPILAKIKAADPDIVYVAAFPPREIAFHKQALEQGVNPRQFHYIHHGAAFREAVGAKNANLATGENYWMPGVKGGPNVAEFEELLQKTGIKVEDFPWASIHFFGFETVRATLEKAGTLERDKLLAAIKGLDIKTISGPLKFNPTTGQGTLNPFPTQIQDGKYVTLWPSQYATGKHIYPRPGSMR